MQRAAVEAVALYRSGLENEVINNNWDAYQHQFSNSTTRRAPGSDGVDSDGIDFDTPLMRLAAGGE